jgi:1,4-dihydroxy-2-naphthoyl-CoA hydrolase
VSDLLGAMPFAERLGVRLGGATPERVSGALDWADDLCTAGGVLHGGALMAAADSLGALCAYLNLPDGATTATLESKINFFRAVRGGTVSLVSTPLHVGRSSIVVQTELTDDAGRPVALVIQTQAVLATV